ncbi:uroporphyrinogen decarboxylase family protein [Neomoorella mulderi]|uniref:Methylcobalamin:coenzyme M methyltransferase n=1 Tax=Moorella mulderi DSM 14980 TaxID=1122241 RepID=A0A151AWX7_9FIRM|nr:uroporphyrinogen decarboxylase family protein [Moorella mulderi]KYH32156.1 methylcobalamin:coenzyme M methyltransferase [Moorella mulderi DSM 14980]
MAQMTSRERLLTALAKGVPDRLPATVHQWQPYHLERYMGGIDALEAFQECGLDAVIQYFEDMGQFWVPGKVESKKYSDEWYDEVEIINDDLDRMIVHHTIHTPKGTLTYKTEGNRYTVWITEFMIKKPEDIYLLKYMPVPKLDKKAIQKEYDRIGDKGILKGFVWGDQAGCWQHACVLYDTAPMIYAAMDDPAWVHEFLHILLEKKLQFIYESLRGAKFDLIETGGGASSSTVISPKMFEEFCLPYDRKIHDALHDVGHIASYHTCGGMLGLFDLIIATNTDCSETLAPKGVGGNIEGPELYEAMHGKVALIGGLDQYNILTNGTPEQVKQEVHRLFEIYGKGGGYIMMPADHFFDAPKENLLAYGEAARECVY